MQVCWPFLLVEDDLSTSLAEHEREKVVSVQNWVVWDFQLLFQYFVSIFNFLAFARLLGMPWPVPAGLSVTPRFFSFVQGCCGTGVLPAGLWVAIAGTL